MKEKVKLLEIATIRAGGTPSRSKSEYWKGNIAWVKISNINGKYVSDCDEYITESGLNNSSAKIFSKGTILYTIFATLGRVGILTFNATTNQAIAGIKLFDKRITNDYLYYYLRSLEHYVNNIGKGVAQKNINLSILGNFEITIIDIARQNTITEELSNIELTIENKQNQLSELDELVKSHFIEMFGDPVENSLKWRKEPLSKIIINVNNGLTRRGHDANGNIVLRLVELQDGVIDYSNVNRIILSEKEKLKFELKNNDFLFARVNGNPQYVGRCAVFHSIDEKVYHNDHIIRVHFDESIINGTFAMVLLNSHYGKSQMRQFISTSAGQYTINQDGIRAIIAILPPLELQNKFAEFVQKVDKAKTIVKKQITDLQELLDSKMSEYFG